MNRNDDLSENLKYTTTELPILTSDEHLSDLSSYRELIHWHGDLEFILVTNGTLDFFINNKVVQIGSNQGLFINSNRLHYGYSGLKEEVLFKMVIVSPDMIKNQFNDDIIDAIICQQNCDYSFFHKNMLIWSTLEHIHKINHARNKNYKLQLQSELCTLFMQLPSQINRESEGESQSVTLLKQMLLYIHKNYGEKIKVEDIASAGMVCKNICYRIFQNSMEMTPLQYLMQYRIQQSMELLKSSSNSIAEVAQACGFCSQSHFTKVFHEIIGMTPNNYRVI